MEKQDVINAIKELREKSPKKNFKQSVDVLINLKDIDLKKPEHNIDLYLQLPNPSHKKLKLGAFVDQQLGVQAKKLFDTIVLKEDFSKWVNNKKDQKKLASSYDFFVAQVELMPQIATTFGKVFGARGKMPNPKAGCVVAGTSNLEPLVNKLKDTIRIKTRNETSIKLVIGGEEVSDDKLTDNILFIYNNVLSKLPQEKQNIRYIGIKYTMGPLIKIKEETKASEKKAKRMKNA